MIKYTSEQEKYAIGLVSVCQFGFSLNIFYAKKGLTIYIYKNVAWCFKYFTKSGSIRLFNAMSHEHPLSQIESTITLPSQTALNLG